MTDYKADPFEGRHPGVVHYRRLFNFDHLPAGPVRSVSAKFSELASDLVGILSDSPELTRALSSLWDAKNHAVMQAVMDQESGRFDSRSTP